MKASFVRERFCLSLWPDNVSPSNKRNCWKTGGEAVAKSTKGKQGNMKQCIETKLAAAVAAGVMALTAGAMAQSQSSGQPPNEYAPSTSPGVNTHMSNRGYNNTPNAGQNQQSFTDEAAPANRQKKSTKRKTGKSSKQRSQQNQQNQDQRNQNQQTQKNQGTQTNNPGR